MEENIIERIAQAEAEATERRALAQARAAEIMAEAQAEAGRIAKASEEACRACREERLKKAQEEADASYEAAIAACKQEARAYADGLLSHTEVYVVDIVGRLTK